MSFYNSLPAPPTDISAAHVLKRLIDGLGFRFQLASQGITDTQYSFRPVPSSMSIEEVQLHIFHLVRLSAISLKADIQSEYSLDTPWETRESILKICNCISLHLTDISDDILGTRSIYLKRTDTTYSF